MSLHLPSGTLAGILYKDGDEVPVTKVIAYILKEGETLEGSSQGKSAHASLEA